MAAVEIEMDAVRLVEPFGEMRDHVEQHFVAVGDEEGPAHRSSSRRAATRAPACAKRLGEGDQVRLMGFEEPQESGEQRRIAGATVSIREGRFRSGRESAREPFIAERRAKRASASAIGSFVVAARMA